MKKMIFAGLLVISLLAVFSITAAYAQGNQPPVNPRGPVTNGQDGPLHDYMMQAFAGVLGIDVVQLETRLANGETMYEIAISQGYDASEVPAIMADARSKALELAVAAGVISQDQADWMNSRGNGRGNGQMGTGTCLGTGSQMQMQGGGRWQQTNP